MPSKRGLEALKLLQINDLDELRLANVRLIAEKDPANDQRYFDAYVYLRDAPNPLEEPTPAELEEKLAAEKAHRELLIERALLLNPPRPREASGPLA